MAMTRRRCTHELAGGNTNRVWTVGRRSYSASPAAAVEGSQGLLEPPEHLDEQERHIFELLRDNLEPVELHVSLPLPPFPFIF